MSSRLFSTYLKSGTHAERLAFTAIPPAIVWHETDTGSVYVYDQGWVLLTASGASGITQLTGPVTAGPGSGSQATVITPTGVTAGSYGDVSHVPQLTLNAAGQVTAATTLALPAAGMTQLTGDVTAGPGSGSQAATLAASGVTAGTYGDAAHVNQLTVNSKGLVTGITPVAITANVTGPASATSGDLASYADATGKVIADAGIPATDVARLSLNNSFTGRIQTISGGTPLLQLQDTSGAANQKLAQLYAGSGLFVVQTVNDAGSVAQTLLQLDRAGNVTTNGPVFERSRSTALGNWVDVPFSATNYSGITVAAGNLTTHAYMLVGNTLWLTVYLQNATIPAAIVALTVLLPSGFTCKRYAMSAAWYGLSSGWETGIAYAALNAGGVYLYRGSQASFPTGTTTVLFTAAVSIG